MAQNSGKTPDEDPVFWMKHVITAQVASWHNCPDVCESRSPLKMTRGETTSHVSEKGSTIYTEARSYNPPQTMFLQKGPDSLPYALFGHVTFQVNIYLKSLEQFELGQRTLILPDGKTKIAMETPKILVTDIYSENKILNMEGTVTTIDKTHGIYAFVTLDAQAANRSGYWSSFLTAEDTMLPSGVTQNRRDLIKIEIKKCTGKNKESGEFMVDVEKDKVLATATGSWLEGITWEKETPLWTFADTPSVRTNWKQSEDAEKILSDACHRLDRGALLKNQYPEADQARQLVMQASKRDDQLRADAAAKKKK